MSCIKIKVPATTANIGPGFDCLGMALDIYNEFEVEEIENGLEFYGCDERYSSDENLFYKSMLFAFERLKYKSKGYRIKFMAGIPLSRGLGSSASLIVGGLIAGQVIAGKSYDEEKTLSWGTEIEGHPDNIAPAIFGGFCLSGMEEEHVFHSCIPVSADFSFHVLIPSFELSTVEARMVLPQKVDFKDAVFNISRSLLLVESFRKGDFDSLKIALKDKLHQRYRGKLIDRYEELECRILKDKNHCIFISGAGPSIMLVGKKDMEENEFIDTLKEYMGYKWELKKVNIAVSGLKLQIK